jgi:hypothetical protein
MVAASFRVAHAHSHPAEKTPSGLYTVNPQGHDPAELKAVALDIRNKAPEIYGLAIKFWTYFNAFGQAPPQWLETMKLDEWLTRLVAVPPGRNPLANGIAIGMRIALFILVPLGIIAAIAILFLHRWA